MEDHRVVSREEWLSARRELLAAEKELTRLRDEVSKKRRALPWEKVDKTYVFDTTEGPKTLADLFAGRSQLITYHFMFDPSWEAGCKSCSFWADNYSGIVVHLNQRDVSFAAVSRAPLEKLLAFKKRMGWTFDWVSSFHTDFNYDYQASFTKEQTATGEIEYNYTKSKAFSGETPGLSVFARSAAGDVMHTYSCYSRGLDMLNGAYHHLDLVPKGRDEAGLSYSMAWLRLHDQYGK